MKNEVNRALVAKKKFLMLCAAMICTMSVLAETKNVDCGGNAQLTATANPGYEFVKWQKDGSDFADNTKNPLPITDVHAMATYTAIFQLIGYTFNPADFGEGVTLNGSSDPITVHMGETITVLYTAGDCKEFVKWSDGYTEKSRTYTCPANDTVPFTVVEKTTTFTITGTADAAAGTVTITLL